MSWKAGTRVCAAVWNAVREFVPEKRREEVLSVIVEALRSEDWAEVYQIEELWPEGKSLVQKLELED